MRAVTPGLEPGLARELPPLRSAREELARQREQVLRLSHALGTGTPWFQERAWPLLLRWEALVAGLPAPGGLQAALTQVLGSAAAAAETLAADGGAELAQARLARAHLAAVRQAWWCACAVRLRSADGRAWDPALIDLRRWRGQAPAPHHVEVLSSETADDPWGRAASLLTRRGVWSAEPGRGRWLASRDGWNLLWPLAGRDLVAAARGSGIAAAIPVFTSLAALPGALRYWGYLRAGAQPRGARRIDGRALTVLPVAARLRQRCGLPASLPGRPEIVLDEGAAE